MKRMAFHWLVFSGTYVIIAYIYEVCIVAIYLAGPFKMAACCLKRRTAI